MLERQTLCFSSYKNHILKVKWLVGARERKNRAFFVPFILSEGNFLNICILSRCIVYWIHFQNIHTFTYQKTLHHKLLLLVFKIVESLQCILKGKSFPDDRIVDMTISYKNEDPWYKENHCSYDCFPISISKIFERVIGAVLVSFWCPYC